MTTSAKSGLDDAVRLPASERAALVEILLGSLDQPDPAVDRLWLDEARDRMAAYRAGELDGLDADEVFAKLGQQA